MEQAQLVRRVGDATSCRWRGAPHYVQRSRRRPHRKTLPQPHGQGAERHRRVTRARSLLRARAPAGNTHQLVSTRAYVADTNRDATTLAPSSPTQSKRRPAAIHAAACARNSSTSLGRPDRSLRRGAPPAREETVRGETRIAEDGHRAASCDGPIVTERCVTRAPEDARMFFHWWRFFKASPGAAIRRGRGPAARRHASCSRATRRRCSCPT